VAQREEVRTKSCTIRPEATDELIPRGPGIGKDDILRTRSQAFSTVISVDARLVCATLRSLEKEVEAGRFRADLYYRIQGVTLQVPALRERPSDIAPLVAQFVAELSAKHSVCPPKLTRAAMSALHSYGWPGNVRELRNVLELLCLLRAAKTVRVQDLPAPVRQHVVPGPSPQSRSIAEPNRD